MVMSPIHHSSPSDNKFTSLASTLPTTQIKYIRKLSASDFQGKPRQASIDEVDANLTCRVEVE